MIPFAENYITAKLTSSDSKQITRCLLLGVGRECPAMGGVWNLEVMGNALYPDMCQKTWNCLLTTGIIMCKSYSNVLKVNWGNESKRGFTPLTSVYTVLLAITICYFYNEITSSGGDRDISIL